MQFVPTLMDLTAVLARMDFLVMGKLAKVGKVVSQINLRKFDQDLDSFSAPKGHSSSPHVRKSGILDFGIQNTAQGIRNLT